MAYQDFTNDYKNNMTGSAMVLYGAEDFLISWAIDKIIADNVEEDSRELDARIIDGENTSAYDILSEAKAYSMFSPKRVVVVKNYLPMIKKTADPGMEELADYAAEIAKSSDDSPAILIFAIESMHSGNLTSYAKDLIKSCKSYDFARLERADLTAFINKRVRAAGKMLGSRELSHLIDVTGYYNKGSNYYLTHMDSDLTKLTSAAEDDTIDMRLIDEIMMGDEDKFVFNLIDSMVASKRGKALEITESIIRDEDGAMAVLALLTKQFEIMYDALELSEKGMSISAMSKATGVNEYRFKKAYSAASKYGIRQLGKLLSLLYDTDRQIKSGEIDKDTALELFVVKAAK